MLSRTRFIIALLALLVPTPFSTPAGAMEWTGTVRVNALKVHAGRGSSAPVVKVLNKGRKVVVEGQRRGQGGRSWCGVRERVSGKTLGYVDCDGLTHTMSDNWFTDSQMGSTSAGGVGDNSLPDSTETGRGPVRGRRHKVEVDGKDMTGRYRGLSAVMYMTPT